MSYVLAIACGLGIALFTPGLSQQVQQAAFCAAVIALGEMLFGEETYGLYVVHARHRGIGYPQLRFLARAAVRNGAVIVAVILTVLIARRLLVD